MKITYKALFFGGKYNNETCKRVRRILDASPVVDDYFIDERSDCKPYTIYNFYINKYCIDDISWLFRMRETYDDGEEVYLAVDISYYPEELVAQTSAEIIQNMSESNCSRNFSMRRTSGGDIELECLTWISRATFMKFVGVDCDGDEYRASD